VGTCPAFSCLDVAVLPPSLSSHPSLLLPSSSPALHFRDDDPSSLRGIVHFSVLYQHIVSCSTLHACVCMTMTIVMNLVCAVVECDVGTCRWSSRGGSVRTACAKLCHTSATLCHASPHLCHAMPRCATPLPGHTPSRLCHVVPRFATLCHASSHLCHAAPHLCHAMPSCATPLPGHTHVAQRGRGVAKRGGRVAKRGEAWQTCGVAWRTRGEACHL